MRSGSAALKKLSRRSWEIETGLTATENFYHFLDRAPTACGGRHTEKLFDFSEVTDRLHLPAIQTEDESSLDRNDLQQPIIVRRQTEKERWRRVDSFG